MNSVKRTVLWLCARSRLSSWVVRTMVVSLTLSGAMSFAQYDTGDLVGTIRDQSGAAVPNATVTITNIATGVNTVVKTYAAGAAAGDYEAPSLRVGAYNISATAPGYATAEARNITISVGGRARIDLKIKVGSTQTTVQVSGVALQLETQSSQMDQTFTGYQTEALPLVSLNYSDLVDYVTGSHAAATDATTTAVTSTTRAGSFIVNGQRSMFNDYMINGMDNNAYGESNQGFDNQIIEPPPDSVAQFDVVTNNESAEYGRSSGATVNVATKSGTNEFHGELYEYNRNTALNAFGYIKPVSVNAVTGKQYPFFKPLFNRNQFGAHFGGAFIKKRFFWFVDYEGFRQTLTPTSVETVPTTNELTGSLAVAVQDPWHPGTYIPAGTPFNEWPAQARADADPTALEITKLYSAVLPGQCTVPSGTIGTGVATNDCPLNAPFTDNADKGDLRLDFHQSGSTTWFLTISDRKEDAANYPLLPEPIDMQTNGLILIQDRQAALGYNHVMGANKFLDARLALSSTHGGKWTYAIGNTSLPAGTIPGLPTIADVSGGLPSIAITGGFSSFGRQSTNPQWQYPSLLDPKVIYTWVMGRHSLKFGYEYEKIWQEIQDSNPLYGAFAFSSGYSVCPASAGAACPSTSKEADTYFADFLFGASSTYSLSTYYIAHVYQSMQDTYAQDDWQVRDNLTLNLGLRWEYGSPWWERNNYVSNFDLSTGTMLTLEPGYTAADSPMCGSVACIAPYSGGGRVYGKTLVDPQLADWAPRLGFAYAPTTTIAIRGGYGLSYIHYWRAGSGNDLEINAPFAMYTSVTNPSTVNTTNGFVRLDQGFPAGLATTFSAGTDDIDSIPPNTHDGYATNWFIDVQKRLAKNIIVDIAYVGNNGVHLQGLLNANQKNPALPLTTAGQYPGIPAGQWQRPYMNWGGYLLNNSTLYPTFENGDITQANNEFHSSYNGLQAKYQQQYVDGLTLLNSFTWSHAMDNASATLDANTPSPQNGDDIQADYGQSDYNMPIANVTTLVYDLPVGSGKRFLSHAKGIANAVLGGWQISAVNTMDAGTPFNITYTPSIANQVSPELSQSWRGENLYRPNRVPGVPYIKRTLLANGDVEYVNPAALAFPETYTTGSVCTTGCTISSPFGSLPKNYGRTPAFYETDMDFNKIFNTPAKRVKIEFRAEFFNIFNHTNLYLPGGSGGGTIAGTYNGTSAPTSMGGGTITGTFEPRIIQLAMKAMW